MLKLGAFIVGVALLAALVGPAIAPFDPASQTLALRLAAPSFSHPTHPAFRRRVSRCHPLKSPTHRAGTSSDGGDFGLMAPPSPMNLPGDRDGLRDPNGVISAFSLERHRGRTPYS